jgi:hypothetical protein
MFNQLYENLVLHNEGVTNQTDKETLLEQLAALEHEQWMKWAKELMRKEKLSEERIARWEKDCFKPYEELTEEMKEFDREWARKVLKIVKGG